MSISNLLSLNVLLSFDSLLLYIDFDFNNKDIFLYFVQFSCCFSFQAFSSCDNCGKQMIAVFSFVFLYLLSFNQKQGNICIQYIVQCYASCDVVLDHIVLGGALGCTLSFKNRGRVAVWTNLHTMMTSRKGNLCHVVFKEEDQDGDRGECHQYRIVNAFL